MYSSNIRRRHRSTMVLAKTSGTVFKDSIVDSNTCTSTRDDLNPKPELTLSLSQGINIAPPTIKKSHGMIPLTNLWKYVR